MRYLELLVTDLTDTTDGHEPEIRTEWIHRDHIETIEPYLADDRGQDMLWLHLTLTSGRTRYIPVRPTRHDDVDHIARDAIAALLETGHHPLHAAALDTDLLGDTECACRAPS